MADAILLEELLKFSTHETRALVPNCTHIIILLQYVTFMACFTVQMVSLYVNGRMDILQRKATSTLAR